LGAYRCSCGGTGYSGPRCETEGHDLSAPDTAFAPQVRGCTDSMADTFDASAVVDDGSCTYAQLVDRTAAAVGGIMAACSAAVVPDADSGDGLVHEVRPTHSVLRTRAVLLNGRPYAGHAVAPRATPLVPTYKAWPAGIDLSAAGAVAVLRYIRMRGPTRDEFEAVIADSNEAPELIQPSCIPKTNNQACRYQGTAESCTAGPRASSCDWDLGTTVEFQDWLESQVVPPAVTLGSDARLDIIFAIIENWSGRAIDVEESGVVTIARSCLWHNTVSGDGGGGALRVRELSHVVISDSRLDSNRAELGGFDVIDGGALLAYSSDVVISGCTMSENNAGMRGGGLALLSRGNLTLLDTLVESNAAGLENGNALCLDEVVPFVRDSTIAPYGALSETVLVTVHVPHGCYDESILPLAGPCAPGFGCFEKNFGVFCDECGTTTVSAGRGPCRPCPPGHGPSADGGDCTQCDNGFFSDVGICSRCAPGSSPSPDLSGCLPCRQGLMSADGVACVHCLDGLEPLLPGATGCVSCPAGRFSDQHQTQCEACPSGQYALSGAGSCRFCEDGMEAQPTSGSGERCVACSAGRAGTGGACEQCPPARAPDAFTGGTACLNCTDLGRGLASVGGRCETCAPGTAPDPIAAPTACAA